MRCDLRNCEHEATRGVMFDAAHQGRILLHACDEHAETVRVEKRRQGPVVVRMAEPFAEWLEEL